ncbi:hypothetical protein FHS18_005723 [Paenibacillus phyllosphaerae]|uniref:HTH LytTR-type domain-containing protein n=1 Tax=Paenibacillus phyllosphaerae TaxID=274593 RepID=A0A7W5B384_9BACL|nr:hypothetical protein [Paenibacillus phyllosphaerae]MBB3113610.1 hypothetical protein [Paenibacillus phyllosphaerae]
MLEKLAVSADPLGTKPFELNVQDIIFIQYDRKHKGVWFHSLEQEGFLPGSLEFWISFLANSDIHIETFDRATAMNLHKVELLDRKHNYAYFESVIRRDKGCSIAVANFKEVIRALEKLNRRFEYV